MTLLLDTHFLIWILLESRRLDSFPWLERYRPWGISPASLLEIQFLSEVGRLEIQGRQFFDTLLADRRFIVDDPPMLAVFRHAVALSWTRDPFDRLLAAHSAARRVPLCTVDRALSDNHSLIPAELKG